MGASRRREDLEQSREMPFIPRSASNRQPATPPFPVRSIENIIPMKPPFPDHKRQYGTRSDSHFPVPAMIRRGATLGGKNAFWPQLFLTGAALVNQGKTPFCVF